MISGRWTERNLVSLPGLTLFKFISFWIVPFRGRTEYSAVVQERNMLDVATLQNTPTLLSLCSAKRAEIMLSSTELAQKLQQYLNLLPSVSHQVLKLGYVLTTATLWWLHKSKSNTRKSAKLTVYAICSVVPDITHTPALFCVQVCHSVAVTVFSDAWYQIYTRISYQQEVAPAVIFAAAFWYVSCCTFVRHLLNY